MKKNKKKAITLCSSAAFFSQMIETEAVLNERGFSVFIPLTANKMKRSGDFRVETYKTWFKNPNDYKRKTFLMRDHFNKIAKSDAILVLNHEKKGVAGYIGGATLLEMGLALYLKKKIYVLNPIDESSTYKEEILAMQPVILNSDLSRVK